MKASFFEFTVANSALFTARGALNVINHNVANAGIPGYSRQLPELRAGWPLSLNTGKGMVGTGSEIYGIKQMRDIYLDKKYWRNVSSLGEYTVKQTQLSLTETILNEMSGSGLKTQFNDFFYRIQELSTNAGDSTYRTNLLQMAASISTFFDNTYQQMHRQQSDVNQEVKATVSQINSLSRQIASLNKQISQYELTGQRANDLRDQRALLVDNLTQYVSCTVEEKEMNEDYAAGKYPAPEDRGKSDKVFSVIVNGHVLVDGYDSYEMECRERKVTDPVTGAVVYVKRNPEDIDGLYDIYWKGDNSKFNLYSTNYSGQLKALIDLRDGNNQNYLSVSGASGAGSIAGVTPVAARAATLTLTPPDATWAPTTGAPGTLRITDTGTGVTTAYPYADCALLPNGNYTFTWPAGGGPALPLPAAYSIDLGGGETPVTQAAPPAVTAEVPLTSATITIDLSPPADRVDLSQTGGTIRLYDTTSGTFQEYTYSKYSYDPVKKQGTFTLVNSPSLTTPVLPPTYRITVSEADPYKGLPYYMGRLNDLARTVVQAMNTGTRFKDGAATTDNFPASAAQASGAKELIQILGMESGGHMGGYNANGDRLDTLFFTYFDSAALSEAAWNDKFNIYNVTAETIRINNDLIKDPRLLQASDTATGGISNNNIVLSFLKVNTDKSLFKEGTLGDYIIGITGELGVQFKQTKNFVNSYTDMTVSIDNQRLEVSSVSLDEEMTAMIMYQQQYVAASKLINVIDSIYDITVNRLGAF